MSTPRYAILEAPSALGLFPGGVETLPAVLIQAGLADRLRARRAGRVDPPPYVSARDPETHLLNPAGLREYSTRLADAVEAILDHGEIPVVLGGDCSILLGTSLALRRRGRFGLLFLDGHADFYQPEAEPSGEVASMDLALATGSGPAVLADLEGRRPLVRPGDVAHLGRRDEVESAADGSQRIEDTAILVLDLRTIRRDGIAPATRRAIAHLDRADLGGFLVHLDCDVLDDAIMPAVDYWLPGGLSWDELGFVLQAVVTSGRMVGLEVTIFNPRLDPTGAIAADLVACLAEALRTF